VADCNVGKSYAVLVGLLRPLLEKDPRTPLLFWSVRISHVHDLIETLKDHFMRDDPRGRWTKIRGVEIETYKDRQGESVHVRCSSSQLVLSAETALRAKPKGSQFRGAVAVSRTWTLRVSSIYRSSRTPSR
jgi:hypothetical protein